MLRSLHLPKNSSLYVLTPEIAPTATTSKNRYVFFFFFCKIILNSPQHPGFCGFRNYWHTLLCTIVNCYSFQHGHVYPIITKWNESMSFTGLLNVCCSFSWVLSSLFLSHLGIVFSHLGNVSSSEHPLLICKMSIKVMSLCKCSAGFMCKKI